MKRARGAARDVVRLNDLGIRVRGFLIGGGVCRPIAAMVTAAVIADAPDAPRQSGQLQELGSTPVYVQTLAVNKAK
jgi:hypothetical protein